MRVTMLVDNEAEDGLQSEHGLSFLVETSDGSVVFDTGQSESWWSNLQALGRDTRAIRAVAVSHGHYDHAGGLPRALKELPDASFHAHPGCFRPKYSRSDHGLRFIGMPTAAASHRDDFTLNTSALALLPGVTLSGDIAMKVGEGLLEPRFVTGDGEPEQDTFEDEQSLVAQTGTSTVVLVGCAHRGLENNVLAAMEAVGVSRIDLLAGGFHLGNASEERLDGLARWLLEADIREIAGCHCTGAAASEYLSARLGSRYTAARAGMSWVLE